MREPTYCPYCKEKLQKEIVAYACQKCKVLIYIRIECTIDSPLLKDGDSVYDWDKNEEGFRIHHFE